MFKSIWWHIVQLLIWQSQTMHPQRVGYSQMPRTFNLTNFSGWSNGREQQQTSQCKATSVRRRSQFVRDFCSPANKRISRMIISRLDNGIWSVRQDNMSITSEGTTTLDTRVEKGNRDSTRSTSVQLCVDLGGKENVTQGTKSHMHECGIFMNQFFVGRCKRMVNLHYVHAHIRRNWLASCRLTNTRLLNRLILIAHNRLMSINMHSANSGNNLGDRLFSFLTLGSQHPILLSCARQRCYSQWRPQGLPFTQEFRELLTTWNPQRRQVMNKPTYWNRWRKTVAQQYYGSYVLATKRSEPHEIRAMSCCCLLKAVSNGDYYSLIYFMVSQVITRFVRAVINFVTVHHIAGFRFNIFPIFNFEVYEIIVCIDPSGHKFTVSVRKISISFSAVEISPSSFWLF